jgi:hypothetical protein
MLFYGIKNLIIKKDEINYKKTYPLRGQKEISAPGNKKHHY